MVELHDLVQELVADCLQVLWAYRDGVGTKVHGLAEPLGDCLVFENREVLVNCTRLLGWLSKLEFLAVQSALGLGLVPLLAGCEAVRGTSPSRDVDAPRGLGVGHQDAGGPLVHGGDDVGLARLEVELGLEQFLFDVVFVFAGSLAFRLVLEQELSVRKLALAVGVLLGLLELSLVHKGAYLLLAYLSLNLILNRILVI